VPRRLQAECRREQGFDLVAHHHAQVLGSEPAIEPPIVMFVDLSNSTENGIEPVCRASVSSSLIFSSHPRL
jgi:hypothetical protein